MAIETSADSQIGVVRPPAANYLTEHSAGSILRASVGILVHHFGTVVLVLVVPALPLLILYQELYQAGHMVLGSVAYLLYYVVGIFTSGALAIALADVCLGNRPSAGRAYQRVFRVGAGKLFLTSLGQILAIMLGMVLLVIPGLVASIWLLFGAVVVVLEDKWGFEAYRRSKRLGNGYHWRNAGVLVAIVIAALVPMFIIGGIFGALGMGEHWIMRTIIAVLTLVVLMPLMFIVTILLYYDLRVRKESYDTAALAEALRR